MKKIITTFFLFTSCMWFYKVSGQGISVNTDNTPAHASAILDVSATNKGILVPRMTATQRSAIVNPAMGLLVYQTDTPMGFQYYNGTTWIPLGGIASSGWSIAGNGATATDFLGTTNNEPLRFRSNNLEHARLTQRGGLELGINTSNNLFIGRRAGANADLTDFLLGIFPNTFIGQQAGEANTNGNANHFVGYQAGQSNTIGNDNTFIGYQTGRANTTGMLNHFVGYQAGAANTSGARNHFVGFRAGWLNTFGGFNTFMGYFTGSANTSGNYNHFVGYEAGQNNTEGSANHFEGYQAGGSNTTGINNTFVGYTAGLGNITGNQNTFMGYQAGLANTTGSDNLFFGYDAGKGNTTGNANLFLGFGAGMTNQTGRGNLFLGNSAGRNLVNPNDRLVIANNSATSIITGNFITGQVFNQNNTTTWSTTSDRRIKQNVRPLEEALTTLQRVRLVRYEFTPEWVASHPNLGGRTYLGVIAQEYREVFPDDVIPTGESLPGSPEGVLGVDMSSAQIMAIRAIQELAAKVEALKKENAALKTELGLAKKTQAKVDELEAKLNEVLNQLKLAGSK